MWRFIACDVRNGKLAAGSVPRDTYFVATPSNFCRLPPSKTLAATRTFLLLETTWQYMPVSTGATESQLRAPGQEGERATIGGDFASAAGSPLPAHHLSWGANS